MSRGDRFVADSGDLIVHLSDLRSVACEVTACGCRIEGKGSLTHPLRIVRCPLHEQAAATADELRHALGIMEVLMGYAQSTPEGEILVKETLAEARRMARRWQKRSWFVGPDGIDYQAKRVYSVTGRPGIPQYVIETRCEPHRTIAGPFDTFEEALESALARGLKEV